MTSLAPSPPARTGDLRPPRSEPSFGELGAATALSAAASALAVAAAAAGLLVDDLYRDNQWTTLTWRGNDAVTLAAVPVLLGAALLARRGSLRALLVWLGMLGYLVYNFAFYLFGAAFNDAFLLYAAIVPLSAGALVATARAVDPHAVARRIRSATPVGWVCGYLAALGLGLAGAWIAQSLAFVVGDELPQIVTDSGHPTSVVFALDLTVLVPLLVLAAVLLGRRRPWGYVLATAMLVKAVTYAAALLAMAAFQADAGLPDAWSFAPFSAAFLIGGAAGTALLLTNLRGAAPAHPSEVTHDDR